jgi:hypothetical protein
VPASGVSTWRALFLRFYNDRMKPSRLADATPAEVDKARFPVAA